MEMAPALVGATRGACRAYIGYFFRHWAHRKAAHDDVLDVYVDNFLKPRNLEFAGQSMIRSFPMHGPTGYARPSPSSTSRPFLASAISPNREDPDRSTAPGSTLTRPERS